MSTRMVSLTLLSKRILKRITMKIVLIASFELCHNYVVVIYAVDMTYYGVKFNDFITVITQ